MGFGVGCLVVGFGVGCRVVGLGVGCLVVGIGVAPKIDGGLEKALVGALDDTGPEGAFEETRLEVIVLEEGKGVPEFCVDG